MRSCHETMTQEEGLRSRPGICPASVQRLTLTLLYISSNHNMKVWQFTTGYCSSSKVICLQLRKISETALLRAFEQKPFPSTGKSGSFNTF